MVQKILNNVHYNQKVAPIDIDEIGQGAWLRAAKDLKPDIEGRLAVSAQNFENQLRYSKRVASACGIRNMGRKGTLTLRAMYKPRKPRASQNLIQENTTAAASLIETQDINVASEHTFKSVIKGSAEKQ